MNTYEGTCRYCGEMKLIIAESQESADNLISAGCSCGGADEDQKIKKICENAKEIAEGLEPIITDIRTSKIQEKRNKRKRTAGLGGVFNEQN